MSFFFLSQEEEKNLFTKSSDSVFLVAELLNVAVALQLQHVLHRPQECRYALMNIRRLAGQNSGHATRSDSRVRLRAMAERVKGKSRRRVPQVV